MKHVLLLPAAALAVLCCSFSRLTNFVPPGTARLHDSLFADTREVSNAAWRCFEHWTKTRYGTNSPQHLATLPDTTVWRQPLSCNEPYVQYYYRHPAYDNYPVVGISYEQALAYCTWRSEQVNEQLSAKKSGNRLQVEYRLPEKREWEMLAASTSQMIDRGGKDKNGRLNVMCANPAYKGDCLYGKYHDVMAPVDEFPRNALGLYHTAGNAAEMVKEKGISKGGSWRNVLGDCRPEVDAHYTGPTAWLGFRCVCVVRK